ncbi:MAG: type III pantothenate kinase [Nocardioidaceae bacterium]
MLLAVDIGNSDTVLGLFDGADLTESWRVSTEDRRTADEWYVLVSGLVGATTVTGVAVCSTVPHVLHEMRQVLTRYYPDVPHVVVEPGVRTGVPVLTDNPREVGSDRIVNALAAATLFQPPCIVVDLGTATTVDAISARGEYLGGAIAPGIEISLEALGRRGAQLRRVELVRPRSVIAKNTVEALQAGAVFGFAGQVDGLVKRTVAALEADRSEVTVVATGTSAPTILSECAEIDEYEPRLTLHGLRLVFDRNQVARPG